MNNVVLITGASSGIGIETAKLFQVKNWKVAATMRRPEDFPELQRIADIECIRLDVTDITSINSAIAECVAKFGRIDAIVNNAGYAVVGPFEAATDEQIRRQFDTNVFGLMNVCREVLPYFRDQRRGIIVNVASVGGRMSFPLYSIYNSSKWAVEGFSESLQYELEDFNIRVKVIEPGPIKSDFYTRSQDLSRKEGLTVYDPIIARALPRMQKYGQDAPGGEVVAEVIYEAVTDKSKKMRYGVNTKGILTAKRMLPEGIFRVFIRKAFLK